MNFASDTTAPAHPDVLQAVLAANDGAAPSYGADRWTKKAQQALSAVFETEDIAVTFVNSGTAANALALSVLCPPDGAILCHENAHINRDERGAPEFYTHGGKLHLLAGAHDLITVGAMTPVLADMDRHFVHETPVDVLSLSQLSEAGTAYTREDVKALCALAHNADMRTHMDGARLANALVSTGCSPADMTWRAGVDVLSFGFTKNGALGAEAIILFGEQAKRLGALEARRKRGGHMPPKQRFVAAQVLAMLQGGLWLDLAGQANKAAQVLAEGFVNAGASLQHPVHGNEVFVCLRDGQAEALRKAGAQFYDWPDGSARFVTCWNTTLDDVQAALRVLS
ncbi:MAG: beta-eliminating lyase-related protein [Robiginitomaculum sp.]|nr:beta-eliminating lyase-related protein [Robiginitomaculum sp.]MDQ7076897.1 beta-eliminating lyase-related protein [Robiginitomaculum sp.]